MGGYCPDHDPILAGGHLRCPECGRAGYPVDAEWAGEGLVLASYAAPCEHYGPETILVSTALLTPSETWCNATASSTGQLCRRPSTGSTGYCRWHRDGARRR
jgi:hypothetical protein